MLLKKENLREVSLSKKKISKSSYLEQLYNLLESGNIRVADTIFEVYNPLTNKKGMNDASNTK